MSPGSSKCKRLGLEYLNKEGYINLASIAAPDSGFGYGKHKTPAVAYRTYKETGTIAAGGNSAVVVEDNFYVHPIFFRDRWKIEELASPSSPYWDELKPVWQLATLLLEESIMSGYLIGMLDRSSHIEIQKLLDGKKSIGSRLKTLEITEEADRRIFGSASAILSTAGLSKHGVGSEIGINESILSILLHRTKASEYSYPWSPCTDDPTARLRLQWSLATTMVHELIHALWYAHNGAICHEPFYRDTRFSELGWQWTTLLFGGAINAISERCESPYGLKIRDWPGALAKFGYPVLKNFGSQPPKEIELYPVSMRWVARFFRQEFWDKVEKFGTLGVKCPRVGKGVVVGKP